MSDPLVRKISLIIADEFGTVIAETVLPRAVPPPPPLQVSKHTRLADALAYLASNQADLVIIDPELPDSADPVVTFRTIRETFPGVKILIVTSQERADIIAEATAAGVPFIDKQHVPDIELLARLIAEVLR